MFRSLNLQYGVRKTSGFTLLELLLVVFIMSVLAFSAVSLTDVMDSSQDQYRYERAKNQAVELKKAIIDRVETQQVVRGFVADIGALPANMMELAFGVVDGDPSDVRIDPSSLRTAMYDLTPDGDGLQTPDAAVAVNGQDGIIFLPASLNLVKGFRGTPLQTDEGTPRSFYRGSYLSDLLPGKNIYDGSDKPRFDDGWGNQNGSLRIGLDDENPVVNDDLTHGWVWTNGVNDDLTIVGTFGKDGAESGTEYAEDYLQLATISRDDWSVDPSAIQVELHNDLADWNAEIQYRFALLVYYAKEKKWRRIQSNSLNLPQFGQKSTATFPSSFRIPAGTHVLMLIQESGIPSTGISHVSEKTPGTDSVPEVQTIVLSQPPAPFTISATLPDPMNEEDPTITHESGPSQTIYDAINDPDHGLNKKFEDEGYSPGPLTYSGTYTVGDITIELISSSGGALTTNQVTELIGVPDPIETYRAKHVHILPGQTNIFRLSLSSIAQ